MPPLPADPLTRFLDIAKALTAETRWWEDRSIVRYAAMPLVAAEGPAAAVAASAVSMAATFRQETHWTSELRSSLRYVLAAIAVAEHLEPARFAHRIERVRERFRLASVRRGGAYELVAAAMLLLADADSDTDVARMQKIYETMKAHHWWLTGPEDLPACALLAVHGGDPAAMPQRIESLYRRLREGGLPARDGTQMASHVLFLGRGSELELATRFSDLDRRFRDAGIAMWDCDRDELALLCLCDRDTARLVADVVAHRASIRFELGHVGPTTSFSYACGTAFLQALAGQPADATRQRLLTIAHLAMATNAASVLRRQRAAASASAAT